MAAFIKLVSGTTFRRLLVSQPKAGGLLRTATRPTLDRRITKFGPCARAQVNANTMVLGSVGHHEQSPLVYMSITLKVV